MARRRPRFHIVTLGCPKNVVDSEGMAQVLRREGLKETEDLRRADVIVVNTCGFIGPAREESLRTLRELAARKGRGQLLVAAGCLVQRFEKQVREAVPGIDAVLGARRWPEIGPLVQALLERRQAPPPTFSDGEEEGPLAAVVAPFRRLGLRRRAQGVSAYLKIADGCDAPCAFCAIPLIKGRARSKPLEDVVAEARELAAQGVQEFILVAQDTTAYGRDLGMKEGLARLLRALGRALPETAWIRILYAYPAHVTDALIEAMVEVPQVLPYLDLPLQHGHPETLKRMRRPHRVDRILRRIEALRAALPGIALRTAFIVGFPGETEEEFQGLLEFAAAIRFDRVGVFTYSPEPGTAAYEMPGQVPEEVKAERRDRLMALLQEISYEIHRGLVGKTFEVLVEGVNEAEGLIVGRSYRDAPEIDGYVLALGRARVGERLRIRITEPLEYDLWGEVVPAAPVGVEEVRGR